MSRHTFSNGSVRALATLFAATALLSACSGPPTDASSDRPAPEKMLLDNANGVNWPAYGRTYGEQHFSPLTTVNDTTVGNLGLMWSLDLPAGNSVTQPLAIDGILYFATGYSVVHAVDAVSGKAMWTYDPKAPEAAGDRLRRAWGSRGIAYANGKIFTGTVDGRLIAINAYTGDEVWSQQTLKQGDVRYITGAPRVFDGKVIIGHGGADSGNTRGYVTAYDIQTGKKLWRFYTVPGNPAEDLEDPAYKMAAKTWAGEWWKVGGGGTVWNAMTYDAGTRTIILGTGNGAPWNRRARSKDTGDNLFLSSIVGLDAETGKYKWHYQVNPGETWDYNAAMDMHLADLPIGGKIRKVLITAPKNGFLYVIDRTNGKFISAERIAKVTWASGIDQKTGRPIEIPAARYPNGTKFEMWPGSSGAHSHFPSAFSPATGLIYIPLIESGLVYSDAGIDTAHWKRAPHAQYDFAVYPLLDESKKLAPSTSFLLAWNPITQTVAWKIPTPKKWNGGLMATAGNLVFQGQADGKFNAYNAKDGKLLWSFGAEAPVLAAPITYSAGGRQYVTVITGMGTTAGMDASALPLRVDYRTQPRRVLTFALGGKGALPRTEPAHVTAVADPDYRADPAAEMRGAMVFGQCMTCHGMGADAGGGMAPDLRASSVILSAEALSSVLHDGALVANGMPRFAEFTPQQREDLRQFLRSRAAAMRAGK